jgi:glycosyltransferase involved in cell wall biosynthesis
MKKKIALIVDTEDWAFANIANMIKKNLSQYYDFKIIPLEVIDGNIIQCFILCKDYDLIHFFWRGYLNLINEPFAKNYINSLGMDKEIFIRKYIQSKTITTCVYDHLFLKDKEEIKFTNSILSKIKEYYVSSMKLFNIYNNMFSKKPKMIITDGVDLDLFKPQNIKRFVKQKDKYIIGWVGNSLWGPEQEDSKGLNKIIKPAIKELIDEGYNIEINIADKQIKMIRKEDMPKYYSNIDIYVCASLSEGTPNPVLEAMACGIPIISTDVGIVREAFGEEQAKYILEERSKDCLKKKIIELLSEHDNFRRLSEENIEQIKKWTWHNKIKDFKKFFDYIFIDSKDL